MSIAGAESTVLSRVRVLTSPEAEVHIGIAERTTAARPLLQRLPRVSGVGASLSQQVYCAGTDAPLTAFGAPMTWQWRPRLVMAPPVVSAELTAAGMALRLIQYSDRGLPSGPDLDWRSLAGEAQLLAWTVSYEPVLAHLSRLFAAELEPLALVHGGFAAELATHTALGFRIVDAAGLSAFEGAVVVADSLLSLVRGWPRGAALDGRADHVSLAAAVRLGQRRMALRQVLDLERGDVVLVGMSNQLAVGAPVRWVPRGAGVAFVATLGAHQLTLVRSVAHPVERPAKAFVKEKLMSATTSDSGLSPEQQAEQLDRVPVNLAFDVGEMSISVGELKRLGPGYVLSLDAPLDQSVVTIKANGADFARGELVAVGDALGVRLVELLPHGLR
jgi:type III secretion protein Q